MEVPDLFIHPVTGNVVFLCPYRVGCSNCAFFFTKCIH